MKYMNNKYIDIKQIVGMAKIKIMIEGYQCERCEHKWVPRETTTEEPKVCPKCKSPYWNIPKKKNQDMG